MSSERQWLREALQEIMLPKLTQLGFAVLPLSGEDAKSREVRAAFPFGRFRREGRQGFEQIEIQLHTPPRAQFRLNVGVVPRDGVRNKLGSFEVDQVWVSYLPEHAECPSLHRWFSVRRWPWQRETADDYRQLVTRVAEMTVDIELFFKEQKSRNLRRVRVSW